MKYLAGVLCANEDAAGVGLGLSLTCGNGSEQKDFHMSADDGLPPDEAKRLAAFMGEWTVAGSLMIGEERAEVSGRWRFEQAIDGWGVIGIMRTEIEGMGTFEENELVGFDEVGGNIHLFSMNKFTIRDHVGGWTGEDTLLLEYSGTNGEGKLVTEEITIDFIRPDGILGHVIEKTDGEVMVSTDLILERRS